ncbi:hypothetical protein [Desulfonema ishimotonii]|nr:hypothetical protein [Desulfonema ishimotonii]
MPPSRTAGKGYRRFYIAIALFGNIFVRYLPIVCCMGPGPDGPKPGRTDA